MNEAYIFHFGRQPELSKWELERVVPDIQLEKVQFDLYKAPEIGSLNPQELQEILGGTRKISSIVGTLDALNEVSFFKLVQPLFEKEKKCIVGLSYYTEHRFRLSEFLITVKSHFKKNGYKIRVVIPKDKKNLNSAEIIYNKLTMSGNAAEFNIIEDNEGTLLVTKTITIQDIDDYADRDFNRPKRRTLAGLMPPKLAKIMVNLSGLENGVVCDPFCGDGTILQEALVLGFQVIGSDIDESAVRSANQNIEWFTKNYGIQSDFSITQSDVLQLKKIDCDVIVTEGDLGPARKYMMHQEDALQFFGSREMFYVNVFKTFEKKTTAECVVFGMPAFRIAKNNVFEIPVEFLDAIAEKTQWKRVVPAEDGEEYRQNYITYIRPDQLVGRTITVWERR